jgi:protein-L-isoaspartate(D-aspartate) O-methyltransferase
MDIIIDYNITQERLIDEIKAGFNILPCKVFEKYTSLSPQVEAAIRKVPRDKFVDDNYKSEAFANIPLPIGYGQTISQPFIVAIMTEILDILPNDKVLEIGTGSGYQAAILAQLAKNVYTIEVVHQLAEKAESKLQSLGYNNIHLHLGNGALGWLKHTPYDKIIITAATKEIPKALLDQLKPGGRMILPFGSQDQTQMLTVIDKDFQGNLKSTSLFPVKFVPFV